MERPERRAKKRGKHSPSRGSFSKGRVKGCTAGARDGSTTATRRPRRARGAVHVPKLSECVRAARTCAS